MLSQELKYLMSCFLVTALTCGYLAIVFWEGALPEKFVSTGVFSGVIFGILGYLWMVAVKEDENALARVNIKNLLADKAALEYKAQHIVNCPNCEEPNIDRDKNAYCPHCNKLLPEWVNVNIKPTASDTVIIEGDAICPHCGKENNIFNSTCWFCNAKLPKIDVVKCSNCGATNDVTKNIMWQNRQDSVFCAKCHTYKLPKKPVIKAGPESGV